MTRCTECGEMTENTDCRCCDDCIARLNPLEFTDPVALRIVADALLATYYESLERSA